MQSVNTLAIVDRVVGKIRSILNGYSLTDWAGSLRRATTAYNEKSHSYLMGSAPDDVKGSAELQYEFDKVHGEQIKHNNDKWRQKARRIRDAGAFRAPRPRDTWERIDAPSSVVRCMTLLNLKEQMSEMVQIRTQSRHPLRCLLAALILILGSTQDREGEGEQGRRR